jgi:hypothetical protein
MVLRVFLRSHSVSRALWITIALVLSVACGSSPNNRHDDNGTGTPDAAVSLIPPDGGATDAGGPDAGAGPDAGTTPPDSGEPAPSDAGPTFDAGASSPDAGLSSPDAGSEGAGDGGLDSLSCGPLLTCLNGCGTSTTCENGCIADATSTGLSLFVSLEQCILLACPDGDGGVCNMTALGYNMTTCDSCVSAAQTTGSCVAQLAACGADMSASPTDGGVSDGGLADAGFDNPLGGNCLATASCAAGLECFYISAVDPNTRMCSISCTTSAECGTNEGIANVCVGGACFLGCDPEVADACGRPDFVCEPESATTGVCQPDCNQQPADYCANQFTYPYDECDSNAADPNYGACIVESGSQAECGTGLSCEAGEACYNLPFMTSTSVCVDECTLPTGISCTANSDCPSGYCQGVECQSCPLGFSCNPSSNACILDSVANYGACVSPFQCPVGDQCFHDGATTAMEGPTAGHCYALCDPEACPTGQECVMGGTDLYVCLAPCTTSIQCPATTTCQNGLCLGPPN